MGADSGMNSPCPRSLVLLEDKFAVCRLTKDASIPAWAMSGQFFSITHTADELSIVCREAAVPPGIACERDWRSLRIAGAIPFTEVGVLAALTTSLAEAGISIFAISTLDTDYLLVKELDLERAVDALRRQGHAVEC